MSTVCKNTPPARLEHLEAQPRGAHARRGAVWRGGSGSAGVDGQAERAHALEAQHQPHLS